MFTILECVTVQHDETIVALSAGIALLGMLSFFHLLLRAEESAAGRRRSWIAIAALTAGSSIWATHFVAMLAYRGCFPSVSMFISPRFRRWSPLWARGARCSSRAMDGAPPC